MSFVTLQGVTVNHTQDFSAGGAAVRNAVAGTIEMSPWARFGLFLHNSVKNIREGMHLWDVVQTESALVGQSYEGCDVLVCRRTSPQIAGEWDFPTGDLRHLVPEVKLTNESFIGVPILSIRECTGCVPDLMRTLLRPATIKEPQGAIRAHTTQFHARMLNVICFTSCP